MDNTLQTAGGNPRVEFHFLGKLSLTHAHALQRRLLYEADLQTSPRATVLVCEHAAQLTVGRGGSRGHIHLLSQQLRSRQLAIQYQGRGGGVVPHYHGQLAIYPIVPLAALGWSVGQLLARLQTGLRDALRAVGVQPQTDPNRFGLAGRTGQLCLFGLAIRNGISHQGLFVNIQPAPSWTRFVDVAPELEGRRRCGSVVADVGRPVTMAQARSVLIEHLGPALGCPDFEIRTGHPFCRELDQTP